MKAFVSLLLLLSIVAVGCSSEPQVRTDANTAPPKPAEVKVAATSADVALMAEYIVLLHLADSLIYRPMNDTVAMARLALQFDFTQPNASAAMMKVSAGYMHDVLSKALLPIQQLAGTATSPRVKQMAGELASRVQQVTNQYYRAVKVLEDPSAVGAAEMQQVGMLLGGSTTGALTGDFQEGAREALEAARRALGR